MNSSSKPSVSNRRRMWSCSFCSAGRMPLASLTRWPPPGRFAEPPPGAAFRWRAAALLMAFTLVAASPIWPENWFWLYWMGPAAPAAPPPVATRSGYARANKSACLFSSSRSGEMNLISSAASAFLRSALTNLVLSPSGLANASSASWYVANVCGPPNFSGRFTMNGRPSFSRRRNTMYFKIASRPLPSTWPSTENAAFSFFLICASLSKKSIFELGSDADILPLWPRPGMSGFMRYARFA
mmetsp:Transcript_39261/g.96053  ORF Transcript_39261/g.96053 Transcript_39261/m.96053 type:complete len:241 (-) Transcript_39261:683-1405(-)